MPKANLVWISGSDNSVRIVIIAPIMNETVIAMMCSLFVKFICVLSCYYGVSSYFGYSCLFSVDLFFYSVFFFLTHSDYLF